MTDGLIAIYTAMLYYCCLVFIAIFVFRYPPRKKQIIITISFYAVLIALGLLNKVTITAPIIVALMVLQFIFLKISFIKLNLNGFIISYVILNCFNIVISTAIAGLFQCPYQYLDVIVTSLFMGACALLCVTRIRVEIQQILTWTPKYVLIICLILLFAAAGISTIVSTGQYSPFPEVLYQFIQILLPFLLLIICAVVPMIFVIAISNTKLKSLTSDYEQQIRAQAAHYKELADANHETRRFRHDFANMRIAVEQLCSVGEYDKAMEVLRRQGEQLRAATPGFETGNGIADALLTDKHEKTKQHGGCIVFEGMVAPDAPEPTDLCVILGNTLDNAIEACAGLPEDVEKVITVSSVCCNGFWFLTVRNPIAAPVKISGGSIATTKENKTLHGFGLYSLNSVVRKYDGNVNLSADEHTFTAEIELSLRPQR